LTVQLSFWRALLDAGNKRVGWKLGMGERERIGPGPVIGHLTTATQLQPGSIYRPDGAALHADAEVALELAHDVEPDADRDAAEAAIAGYGVGLELVDLGPMPGGAEGIVAGNVFHRAFALGRLQPDWPDHPPMARLVVGAQVRASALADEDYAELVRSVGAILGAMGERLKAGDHLITGSVVEVPRARGENVVADIGKLGEVGLEIAE